MMKGEPNTPRAKAASVSLRRRSFTADPEGGVVDRPRQRPGLRGLTVAQPVEGAAGRQGRKGKRLRQLKAHAQQPRRAREIPLMVRPTQRLLDQGRLPRRLEGDAQEERTPSDRAPMLLGHGVDAG
jgi:hypothetical protein